MRIIIKVFLHFILIIGILSSIITADENANITESVPNHLFILGYANTTTEDIEKFDIELCEKNGDSNSYDEHKKSRIRYEECLETVYHDIRNEIEEVMEKSSENMQERNTEIYHTIYCRKIDIIKRCLKNFTISMKTCLDVSKHESADVVYNTVDSVTNFACENNAARLIQFTTTGAEECVGSKERDIMHCANQTILNYIKKVTSDGAAIGGLGKYHLLVPDLEKCTVLEDFQHCTMNLLKSCDAPLPDLADSIFKLVRKSTNCNRFLKSQAPPQSIINVLMITVTMSILLRF